METFLTWTGYGVCAVLFVACVVAWYEHLGRATRDQDEPDWESPMPKAMTVDVELEPPAESTQGAQGDQGQRREALGGALARMSNGASGDRRASFGDTAPMILPSQPAAAAPAERRQRDASTTI